MSDTIIQAGIYRHYKGNVYKVIGVAKHADTQEEMVVFRAEAGEKQLWCQSLEDFRSKVKHEGVMVPRFEFIE